ncbi:MAG TPA: efflux RND transporter periplasmic adaptor subunit, partial [Opitutaceae bacterium]|nr:efflux RND transporter periplasmic adaptor subunit [Opitutaceae bacterium]
MNSSSSLASDPSPGYTPVSSRQQPKKNRGRWIAVVIVVAVGLCVYGFVRKSAAADGSVAKSKRGGGTVPVVAASAIKGDIGVYLTGLGTVTPLNNVVLKTRVDGQLMKVLFTEGQFVKEGDLLAEIDPRPFQVQVAQAEGQLLRDEALLKNTRTDLERYKSLSEKGLIAQQTISTQEATVAQYEGSVKSDQAQLDNAKLNLTYSRITAPINGRVGLRQVDAGNMVHASDTGGLLTITQLQPITAVFTIPEDQVPP